MENKRRGAAARWKKHPWSAPFTEEELRHRYEGLNQTFAEIAAEYKVSVKVIQTAMRRMGIRARVAAKRAQSGPANSSWKGGRVLLAKKAGGRVERETWGNGYYYIRDRSHPNAGKNGYVAEHVVIATRKSGYPLKKNEVVHHIDLHKHNNTPDNLVIVDRQQHAIWHVQLEEIAVSFMREGLVAFDPERGYFRV